VTEIVERETNWVPLQAVEQSRLSEARLQAHYALQWLARAARGYIPPQPDDNHTNLGWDAGMGGLITHPLRDGAHPSSFQAVPRQNVRLTTRLRIISAIEHQIIRSSCANADGSVDASQ
jgi:hypothetical protein